ncbi:hypothetical protein [Paramixta manurensis]
MRKARFTEHQIIAVIKSVEAGRTGKLRRTARSCVSGLVARI